MHRLFDVVLNIDSLILKDDESVDDVIEYLRGRFSFGHEPTYEILYSEVIDDD